MPQTEAVQIDDEHLAPLKAIGHPIRMRVLLLMDDGGEWSPRSLSRVIDMHISSLTYHVNLLHTAGLLEPAGLVPRRGAIEHFYRLRVAGWRPLWEQMAPLLPRGASNGGAG